MKRTITDVPGIKVGHYTDLENITGCTVILCEQGAVAGVDVRGSAPGTRETDLIRPMNLVEKVHAVLLTGGSAYGLEAAGGVMRYLEEKGCGYITPSGVSVPIVPAAVIYDLVLGNGKVRPGQQEGYLACQQAISGKVAEGSVGAGTGALVGQSFGTRRATKGGLGVWSEVIQGDIVIGALAVVNALGDVYDLDTGKMIAGLRSEDGRSFLPTIRLWRGNSGATSGDVFHTVLGVVATSARLTKEQANKVAQMCHDGIARVVNPCHTMWDGDAVFVLSTGEKLADVSIVGAVSAEVLARAINRAVKEATSLGGVLASRDILGAY